MKQILSLHYAVIEMAEVMILDHPSTIYTNDNINVTVCDNEEQLNYKISQMSANAFPAIPNIGEWCEINKVYAYGEKMVKCVQSHWRMAFTPEQTPALWLIIEPTGADYPVWKQPAGAHDAYNKGDRVHFPNIDSPVYESLIAANVWSPTGYPAGWKKL